LVIPRGDLICWKFIELLKFQIASTKYQKKSNDQNSKIQTISGSGSCWSRAAQALAPRVEHWNLRFVCNLMLGIFDLF
jgi:hypothetical protein